MTSIRPRSLVEYLSVLWHRKLLIIFVAAIMLKASFMVIGAIPYSYESRASLVVTGPTGDDTQGLGAKIALVMQKVTSRDNLAKLIQHYQLRRPAEDEDAAVQRLRKEIKLETKLREYYPQFPESVAASYRNTNPQTAQLLLTDIVAQFREANEVLKQQAADERQQVEKEMSNVESSLQELSQAQANDIRTALPRMEESTPQARAALVAAIDTLNDRQFALERQIAEQKRQINEQENLARAAATSASARAGTPYGLLLLRKAELEAQLKDYATQYTEKNPKVVQARGQLTEVDRQIARLDTGGGGANGADASSPESREFRSLQRELTRLETDLEVTQRDLTRKRQALGSMPLPALSAANTASGSIHAAEARAEYDRLSKRYTWLMEKQEALRKTAASHGINAPLFQVVDAPFLPQTSVGPNRRLLKLLALGLSLLLGLLVVAAIELPQLFLIKDDHDIDFYLGAPVLGLIPETLTPVETSRARRQWIAWGFGLAFLAAALIPAFAWMLNRLQIFQLIANR